MKSMEAQLKWTMKREEDNQRKNETREDASKLMGWRQDRKKGLKEYGAQRKQDDKLTSLREQRDFQEFKRVVKQVGKEEEPLRANEAYNESKDNSDWAADLKRTMPLEERKLIVDANLEKYTLVSMFHVEESQREKLEQKIVREELEETDLSHQMLQARKERAAALQSLEIIREQQRLSAPASRHIASRPFDPCKN